MQTNNEPLTEFLRGAAFCALVTSLFVVLISGLNTINKRSSETKPEERFRVVDTYGPCEVVRYAPKNGANYAYFLDCK
jgi:hypothetical protein